MTLKPVVIVTFFVVLSAVVHKYFNLEYSQMSYVISVFVLIKLVEGEIK